MSRIRTIKPEFYLDEELAKLPPLCRLLFAALLNHADREGRLEDRPVRIKAHCLPYDDGDCDAMLAELDAGDFIVRYEFNGKRYIWIRTFLKHQRPNSREPESVIPPVPTGYLEERARTRTHAHAQAEGKGNGREGKGTEARGTHALAVAAAPAPPRTSSIVAEACDDWNERYGPGSAEGGKIAGAIPKLVAAVAKSLSESEAESWSGTVRPAWRRYLAETTHPSPSPQDFKAHFADWTVPTESTNLVPMRPRAPVGRMSQAQHRLDGINALIEGGLKGDGTA